MDGWNPGARETPGMVSCLAEKLNGSGLDVGTWDTVWIDFVCLNKRGLDRKIECLLEA